MAVVITTTIQTRFTTYTEIGTANLAGVLPLAVAVRANLTAYTDDAVPIPYPSHRIHFVWDFGDNTETAESLIEPLENGTIKTNQQIGRIASHVYRNPGDYTVTLRSFYFQESTMSWIEGTPSTTTIRVRQPSQVEWWDELYVDPNQTVSDETGTLDHPFRTLAQLRAALSNRRNVAIYLAAGSDLSPAADEDVLTLQDNVGVRLQKYVPLGSTIVTSPRLMLHSSANTRAVVRIVPSKAANQQSEVQQFWLTSATGGSYTITFKGDTTLAIQYNDNAATVQARLEALTAIGSGNVTVSGSGTSGSPFVVTFGSSLANLAQPLLAFTSTLTPTATATITLVRTQSGNSNTNVVQDVMITDIDLDGNNTVGSRGISVSHPGGNEGRLIDFWFRNGQIVNTRGYCVYSPAVLESGGSESTEGFGLWKSRFTHTAASSSGDNLLLAATKHLHVVGCTARGGNGSSANDYTLHVPQFTNTLQQYMNIRWNGFIAPGSGTNQKKAALFFEAGCSDVLVFANNIASHRNGIIIDKTSADPVAWPIDFIIDSNAINNMGISAGDEARGLVLSRVTQVSVRNNRFYENGFDQTTTVGADIDIPDIVTDPTSEPIFIEHNSFSRSYARCGSPLLKIDDYRYLQVFNNAMLYGGIPNGSNGDRTLIWVTQASYATTDRNEVQKLQYAGAAPTSGTFRLNYGVVAPTQTAALDFDATPSEIVTALESLGDIGVGDVAVTADSATGPWYVTFQNALANTDVASITISNDTTGSNLQQATVVNGSSGRVFFDGNVTYAPNLIRSGIEKPFRIGTTFLPFSSTTLTDATWQNIGSTLGAPVAFDALGSYMNPEFRNPDAGNFKYDSTDPLIDFCSDAALRRGTRFDYRGATRSAVPDAGAYEYDAATSGAYNYQPTPITDLPVAGAWNYRDGDVRHLEAGEPVLVTDNPETDRDGRPHRHLAHRDNLIGAALDAVLQDVNTTFCSNPQDGSSFSSAHTSIESFMRVAHNPDGTIRLDAIDLSGLNFLRLDGGNYMLANLDVGDNRLINVAAATQNNDAPRLDQVVRRIGDTMTGTLTMSNAAQIDMGGSQIKNMAAGSAGTDGVNVDQAVKRAGDTVLGTISFIGGGTQVLSMGNHKITTLAAGTVATDAVRYDQVLLLSGGTVTGLVTFNSGINLNGQRIQNVGAAVAAADATRRDQVLLLSGGTMTGAINMGGNAISNIAAAALGSTAVPQFGQCISTGYSDTKAGILTFREHNWINSGVLGTNGHDDYVPHTSVPAQWGNAFPGDGYGICMNAVPTEYIFVPGDDPTLPYFDGHYIRYGPSHPTNPNQILNPNPITQATGNAVYGLAYPTKGHDAANKQYVDDLRRLPEIESFSEQFNSNETSDPGGFGLALPYTLSNLKPGRWMVFVHGTLESSRGSGDNYISSVTVNSVARYTRVLNYPDGAAPITFSMIVTITDGGGGTGSCTINSASSVGRISAWSGFRVGD